MQKKRPNKCPAPSSDSNDSSSCEEAVEGPSMGKGGGQKVIALEERFVAKNILEERDPTKIFKLLKALANRNVPQSTEDLIYWMFLFLCEKWDSVPQFCDECFHYMNKLYFEATADTFWGCGLDIKTIEQAKQREDFHTKQILGTLTGFNILGWLVKVVSLLKSGGVLVDQPQNIKRCFPTMP